MCTKSLDSNITINLDSLHDGAERFIPEIVSLSTMTDTKVSGFIELSLGYRSSFLLAISVENRPAQFIVDPGSRKVKTMGDDLTSVLYPREKIVVGEEVLEVLSVFVGEIEVKEYHTRGTNGVALSGYRMDNYIGSATILPGGSSLTEVNGLSLESVLLPGEVIEVFTNDIGGKQHLTVTSITGSSVLFSPSFAGSTTTRTPMYGKKRTDCGCEFVLCVDADVDRIFARCRWLG